MKTESYQDSAYWVRRVVMQKNTGFLIPLKMEIRTLASQPCMQSKPSKGKGRAQIAEAGCFPLKPMVCAMLCNIQDRYSNSSTECCMVLPFQPACSAQFGTNHSNV